jgi:hypothetical protein
MTFKSAVLAIIAAASFLGAAMLAVPSSGDLGPPCAPWVRCAGLNP